MFEIEKKPLFAPKNLIFQSQKSRIFPKGLTQLLVKKLFSVKIRVEIMFNNVLDSLLRRGTRWVSPSK